MEEENHLAFRGVQGEVLFVLLTILYFIVARFIAVLAHEFLGHGLVSELIGGQFYAVYISPGSGFTAAYLPEATSLAVHIFYLMSGIVVEVIIGLVILFLIYPRLKSFFHRLFTLLLLEVLLIHSLMYMSLASLYGEGGDSMQVLQMLSGIDHFWTIRFTLTGLLITIAFAYVITTKALDLLREHFELRTKRSALRMLLLFWLPHLAVGYIAGLVGFGLVSSTVINYLVLFISVTLLILLFASFYVSRRPLQLPDVMTVGRNGIFGTLIAFLLVLSVWVLAFGVAPSTAHGILLKEPPPEEEIRYTESYAVNLHIMIDRGFNVTTEVSLKAFGDTDNPLEEAIWRTFDNSPYWRAYESLGQFVSKEALNYTGWVIVDHSVGADVHGFGDVWPNGRSVTFRMADTNVSLFTDRAGNRVLRIHDPWKTPYEPGDRYLDAINVTWDESINLENSSEGGNPTSTSITWVFSSYEEAQSAYELEFSS
jgi:hypothetical protein